MKRKLSDANTALMSTAAHASPDSQWRSCYVNFAEHLLNAFNPNVVHPGLPYRWSDADWCRFIDMIRGFGFNTFEFWLVPKLFCREGLSSDYGRELARQMRTVIEYGASCGVAVKMLVPLTTVGADWHTHCPNDPIEWAEVRFLWSEWLRRLPGLGVIGIFPGDPGGCSRNGCTARTFIDKSLEIAELAATIQPQAEIELGTWGNPFFGWGSLRGPRGWQGEFLQSCQMSAWEFDRARAEDAMQHLLRRLPDFPPNTSVAINLGFNPDGNPEAVLDGAQDARSWAREIAKTHRIVTWDFSLTEGENAIFPHYRFERLFAQRRRELAAAPYRGGICYTMTPMLNQLSLFQSAQSFLNPNADHQELTCRFYTRLFGLSGAALAQYLPLLEIVPDWGNYAKPEISRPEFHRRMREAVELLRALEAGVNQAVPFHPSPEQYRQELLFFFELFAGLSADAPDLAGLRQRYWNRIYAIYDRLPPHVDHRPEIATDRLIGVFQPGGGYQQTIFAGKWTE